MLSTKLEKKNQHTWPSHSSTAGTSLDRQANGMQILAQRRVPLVQVLLKMNLEQC